MTAGEHTLEVQTRKPGKHYSRGLRSNNRIPGVVYGPKSENFNVSVRANTFDKYIKLMHQNAIITLKSADDSKVNDTKVLIKEVVRHPVTSLPTHVDFFAPDLTKTVRVSVELHFIGKSIGVKEGGVLQTPVRDAEIECRPTDIPSHVDVDVSELNIGDNLHLSDLQLPDGVKFTSTSDLTVATVVEEKEEEVTPQVTAEGATESAAAGSEAAKAGEGEKKAEGDKGGDKK